MQPSGLSSYVSFGYSPAITADSGPLFDFLKSVFVPQLIRPAASQNVSDALSEATMALALEKPFCMHALLACCGAEIPSDQPCFRQLAQCHYASAVTGLRKNLADGSLRNQFVVTMLTIMMLCIYEVGRDGVMTLRPRNHSPD